ncbi:MAG: nuclear transport factor 2 family protein [Croceibacterium sp.]
MQVYDENYAADRAAIEDLMARYLFALDYNDMDSFIAMFTPDAEFEFARGRVAGVANILETVKGFKQRIGEHYKAEDGTPATLRHVLAHTAIRVEGDRAWTRAQWFEMADDGPGKSLKMGTFGIYEDQLTKIDGHWLFSERRIMNEFLPGRESGPDNPIRSMDTAAGA